MRTTWIIGTLVAVLLSQSVMAQGQGKGPPPPPGDVNVINTPDVNVANVPDVFVVNDKDSPLPVTIQNGVQTIVEWRYVGLTTDEDDGRFEFEGLVGVAAMNKMCAVEYGAGARAASIAEAYFRDDGLLDDRLGWLAPAQPMMILKSQSQILVAVDAPSGQHVGVSTESTREAARTAYCTRYQSESDVTLGPVIFPEGITGASNCISKRPAACSAPVAIPVAP